MKKVIVLFTSIITFLFLGSCDSSLDKPLVEDWQLYMPTSLTVTLYDSENSIYGFTYNSVKPPISPVIQIKKLGDNEWSEFIPVSEEFSSYNRDDTSLKYYISKVEIALTPDTAYVYRAYDKGAGVGSAQTTLTTKDTVDSNFTFIHVSDSQDGVSEFRQVISSVVDTADFLLHTGDFVEYSKYEAEWTEMIEGNYDLVSTIPIMPLSGNHETTYQNGLYEVYKHFNNNIPEQSSTVYGYFYSFVYGDVKFIMLNTNDLKGEKLRPKQYEWLVTELENNTCAWTVVALHNPIYSVGVYGADASRNSISIELRSQLQAVFAQYGVDLVLQGHDHVVSRTYPIDENGCATTETIENINGIDYSVDPDGVIYLMNGPAGSQIREPFLIDGELFSYAYGSKASSWAEIEVSENTMLITVKWHDGEHENIYQTWGLKKNNIEFNN